MRRYWTLACIDIKRVSGEKSAMVGYEKTFSSLRLPLPIDVWPASTGNLSSSTAHFLSATTRINYPRRIYVAREPQNWSLYPLYGSKYYTLEQYPRLTFKIIVREPKDILLPIERKEQYLHNVHVKIRRCERISWKDRPETLFLSELTLRPLFCKKEYSDAALVFAAFSQSLMLQGMNRPTD